jgi:hypothetical protein
VTEQQRNGYEDSDFSDIIAEIEGLEDEKKSIMSEAMGRCSGIAKKIANAKKTATSLKIPKAVLLAVMKQRKLERQLQALADDVPEDLAEVYLDASGQFSFLKPDDGAEDESAPAATKAAKKSAARAKANQAAEQEEGAKVLDELVH